MRITILSFIKLLFLSSYIYIFNYNIYSRSIELIDKNLDVQSNKEDLKKNIDKSIYKSSSLKQSLNRHNDFMFLPEIKVGMSGYGISVFHGVKREKFKVLVKGIHKSSIGIYSIWCKISGSSIDLSRVGVLRGMSGSPVYINNKLIGGISWGRSFSKEAYIYIMPIQYMLSSFSNYIKSTKIPEGLIINPIQYENSDSGNLKLHKEYNNFIKNSNHLKGFNKTYKNKKDTSKSQDKNIHKNFKVSDIPFKPTNQISLIKESYKKVSREIHPGDSISVVYAVGDINIYGTGTVTYLNNGYMLIYSHGSGFPLNITPKDLYLYKSYVTGYDSLHTISNKNSVPLFPVGKVLMESNFLYAGKVSKDFEFINTTFNINHGDMKSVYKINFPKQYFNENKSLCFESTKKLVQSIISRLENYSKVDLGILLDISFDIKDIKGYKKTILIKDRKYLPGDSYSSDIFSISKSYLASFMFLDKTTDYFTLNSIKFDVNINYNCKAFYNLVSVKPLYNTIKPGKEVEFRLFFESVKLNKDFKKNRIVRNIKIKVPGNLDYGEEVKFNFVVYNNTFLLASYMMNVYKSKYFNSKGINNINSFNSWVSTIEDVNVKSTSNLLVFMSKKSINNQDSPDLNLDINGINNYNFPIEYNERVGAGMNKFLNYIDFLYMFNLNKLYKLYTKVLYKQPQFDFFINTEDLLDNNIVYTISDFVR